MFQFLHKVYSFTPMANSCQSLHSHPSFCCVTPLVLARLRRQNCVSGKFAYESNDFQIIVAIAGPLRSKGKKIKNFLLPEVGHHKIRQFKQNFIAIKVGKRVYT